MIDFAPPEEDTAAEPALALEEDGDQPADDFAALLVRRFVGRLENERTRAQMLRLIGSSFSSARQGRALYKFLSATLVGPVARVTGLHAPAMRLELAIAQLTGMAMMRYVLRVEPLASASADEVIDRLTPAIRATLRD